MRYSALLKVPVPRRSKVEPGHVRLARDCGQVRLARERRATFTAREGRGARDPRLGIDELAAGGRIKGAIAILGLVLCGSGLFYAMLSRGGVPTSRVTTGFEPGVVNLGRIPSNTRASFILAFTNRSDHALRFSEVRTSCGCAVVDRDSFLAQVVPPAGVIELQGSIDAGVAAGELERTVTATDEHGQAYAAMLRLEVAATYRFTPRVVNLGKRSSTDGTIATSILFQSDTCKLIGAVLSDSDWLSATLDGDQVVVAVDTSRLPAGMSIGRVTVRTDDMYLPSFSVPVSVSKTSAIILTPSHVFLLNGGARRVRVQGPNGEALHIVRFDASSPDIEIDISKAGIITVSDLSMTPKRSATVSLRDAEGNRATLKVTNLVRPSRTQKEKRP